MTKGKLWCTDSLNSEAVNAAAATVSKPDGEWGSSSQFPFRRGDTKTATLLLGFWCASGTHLALSIFTNRK